MKVLVTGGAGCIGSELVRRLLADGHDVTVFDNLRSGKAAHIREFMKNKNFKFLEGDLLDRPSICRSLKGVDIVFHLAANSDIKYNDGDPTDEDLNLNIIATYNVLECMRLNDVKRVVFTSSSVVYGEADKLPTPEDCPLRPISLYAASKVSCEAMISGFCHMFGMQAWIFRFANIVGSKTRKTGKTIISDFIEKLNKTPEEMEILGNGKQSKSYLLVDDCIDAMLLAIEKSDDRINIFNLGPEDSITVNEIAEIVVMKMDIKGTRFRYTGGNCGWPGDVPKFLLDISKIKRLGWKPTRTSRQAIEIATKSILENVSK